MLMRFRLSCPVDGYNIGRVFHGLCEVVAVVLGELPTFFPGCLARDCRDAPEQKFPVLVPNDCATPGNELLGTGWIRQRHQDLVLHYFAGPLFREWGVSLGFGLPNATV